MTVRRPWGFENELGPDDLLRIAFERKTYTHLFKTLRQNSWGPPHTDKDRDYFALACISMRANDFSFYEHSLMEREWQEFLENSVQNSE